LDLLPLPWHTTDADANATVLHQESPAAYVTLGFQKKTKHSSYVCLGSPHINNRIEISEIMLYSGNHTYINTYNYQSTQNGC
jgi:hypothetical protein